MQSIEPEGPTGVIAGFDTSDAAERQTVLDLLAFSADHQGHAEAVLYRFPNHFRYIDTHGWAAWTGTHWSFEKGWAILERAIVQTLKVRRRLASAMLATSDRYKSLYQKSAADNSNVMGVERRLRVLKEMNRTIHEFDQDPGLLNVANGTIDLRSGELYPHRPDDQITHCLKVSYEPEADYSAWVLWLASLGLDKEVIYYLQKAMGYTATGHVSERILFYIYGPPSAGKGTFLETMQHVMRGPLERGVSFSMFTADRTGNTSNFDLATLRGSRLVVASESNRHRQLNAEQIKSMTGGDEIFCSMKHKPHFSYRPEYKIWVSSNWQPNGDVEDDAFWGRIHLIVFPKSFRGKEDKTLKAKMREPQMQAGLLRWIVDGAKEWFAMTGKMEPPASMQAILAEHRKSQDTISQFVEDCLIVDLETLDRSGNLEVYGIGSAIYNAYKRWCDDEGMKPVHRRRFTASMDTRGVTVSTRRLGGKVARCYNGIKLNDEMLI